MVELLFGGVSIIALGHLFQLESVMDGYVFKDINNSEYAALRYVSFFHFLKFVMNSLKGVVSICHSFRSMGQRGRINGFDRCFRLKQFLKCHTLAFFQVI